MKIGNLQLENNVILAPMAGVNNQSFRQIAREFGTGLVTTEMVSDKAIIYKNEHTLRMLEIDAAEKPISLQLFGSEIPTLVQAARHIDEYTLADIIDINMGCPVPKVTKTGAGSKWLLTPEKIEKAVGEIVKAVNKPVTVKIRTGWDEEHLFAIENAKAIENAGASAIAVHGRTTKQMYTGSANWDIIKQVKDTVKIPVIGNGDITSPEKAKEMIDYTGVDGVMIGRAALGNPWILARTIKYLQTGILEAEPSMNERIKVAFLHMDRLIDVKGEDIAIREMRKHVGWYLKGLPSSAKIREEINKAEAREQMKQILIDYASQSQGDESKNGYIS